jgi:Ras family protein
LTRTISRTSVASSILSFPQRSFSSTSITSTNSTFFLHRVGLSPDRIEYLLGATVTFVPLNRITVATTIQPYQNADHARQTAEARHSRQPLSRFVHHLIPETLATTNLFARATGKSSLAVRYVDGHFVESYYPTIENTFSKEIRYKGQDFATEIVDTAGQDEYSILNSKHFIGIHGYMLVYSVSSLQSFEMVQVIRDKILNHLVRFFSLNPSLSHHGFPNRQANLVLCGCEQGTATVPICIVGNKCDLRPEQRQVTAEEGKALADKYKCAWTEASARYNENVARSFELLIGEVEKSQNPSEPSDGGKCVLM